ncbi:MAG: type II secretion system secretin GspD [Pseudomonadota bacterium]
MSTIRVRSGLRSAPVSRAALCAALVGAFAAQLAPANAQSSAREACGGAINYEDADIGAVVDEISQRTKRKFVLDPRVQGRVTIKSPQDASLCADEIWELFQESLRVNGFIATPINGSSYKIVPAQEGPRSPGPVGGGEAGDLVTQIIKLRHIDARDASQSVNQLASERGVVSPVRSGNAIIVVDSADNIARIQEVIRRIDSDNTIFRTIPLQNASAGEVANVLREVAQELSEEGGRGGQVTIVPVSDSNAVMVRAEPTIVRRLEKVVATLDQGGDARSDLSVVFLKYADAELIAEKLREIANGRGAGGEGGAPATGQRATISVYEPTNAVIINGDPDIQRTLKNVVSQLDIRQAQVQIDAIIVEVSEDTARDLGIEYFISGDNTESTVPFTSVNFSNVQPSILAATGATLLQQGTQSEITRFQDGSSTETQTQNLEIDPQDLATAALVSLLGVNGVGIGGAGEIGDTLFGGIITAIQQDSESRILSAPFATTLDNRTATLSIGQEIPITTGEQIGDDFSNAFRTVSREEVGVILEVTPQVNEGGTVTLEITQETSSVAGQIIESSTDLITNKASLSTTTEVEDGQIIVLGGLIEQQSARTEGKVPLLGDIPLLGNLFKSSNSARRERNQMVFIRPTILRDRGDADGVTNRKLNYLRARDVLSRGAPRTSIERLIDEVTGAGPRALGQPADGFSYDVDRAAPAGAPRRLDPAPFDEAPMEEAPLGDLEGAQ